MSQTGQCRCGRLRFRVEGRPLFTAACHCRGCQQMSGGAFSLTSGYRREDFAVTEGEPVIGGAGNPEVRHYHCDRCKSWVYSEPAQVDWLVNVRTSLLDDPPAEPPFIETATGEGFAWASTGAKHSFSGFPAMDEMEALLAEFARRS